MGLSFKIYSISTFLITSYAFYHLYQKESQLLGLTLSILYSKVYFCIALNFIAMLTLLIGKTLIYLFFEEEVSDKIKVKFFSLFIWFLSFRPSIDLSKIILLVAYFLMAILTFISFKRSSYMISVNEKSKKAQMKIIFIFIFLGILNYSFYHIYKISLNDMSLNNRTEWLVFVIVSNEFILLFIMLIARFYKLVINITSINMGKVWEHRLIVFRVIGLIKYIAKLACEINCFITMFYAGALPFYYIIDFLYNVWNLFKLIMKMYDNYRTAIVINRLRNYNYTDEIKKLNIEELSEEMQAKIKSEKLIICGICLSEIENGKYLSCGHVFHLKCLKEWSSVNVNCPIDKSPLIAEENNKSKFLANQLGRQQNQRANNDNNDNVNANANANGNANANEATDEEILEQINLFKVTKGLYVPKRNMDLMKYAFMKKLQLLIESTQYAKRDSSNKGNSVNNRNRQANESGAVTYALPCEVIYNRGLENEIKRLEKEILNKKLIDLYKNPFNALNQYEDIIKQVKAKQD